MPFGHGLSAYVQPRDEDQAGKVAHRLKAGTVNIDNSFYLSPDGPLAVGASAAFGVEHGVAGFGEYVRIKTIASPSR